MSERSAGGVARRAATPRPVALLMAGALLVPVLAGCTSSGGDRADAAVRAVATADRTALKEGGSVTWAVDALPATLNAFQYDADAVTDRIAGAVLPALFTIDERGRPRLNPDYLRSAEITDREPRQTVVYTLNPEAEWSDGEPLAAADFIAQWKALNGQDSAYWTARNVGYDRIDSVEKGPRDGQVRVTFSKPYADWRSLFTPLYPASVTGKPEPFNEGARDGLPVTAGPFTVRKTDRDKGRITLARSDSWWGDPALLDRLVFAAVPADDRVDALAAGTLDVAEVTAAGADRIAAVAQGAEGAPAPAGDDAPHRAARPSGDADALDPAEAPAAAGLPQLLPQMVRLAEARLAARSGEDAARSDDVRAASQSYARALEEAERSRLGAFAARERETREKLGDYTVYRAYDAAYTQLALNGTSEALRDERVRWALARSLDRETLASEVLGPARLPVRSLGSHLWVFGQEGYRDTSEALGEVGTAQAAELLEAAGWHGGPDLPEGDTGQEGDTEADAEASEEGEDAKTGTRSAPGAVPFRLGSALPAAAQRAALLRELAEARRNAADEAEREGGSAAESFRLARVARQAEREADRAEAEADRAARNAAAATRFKDGRPLQLRFILPDGADGARLRPVAERIAGMLGEAGVHAEITEVAGEAYFREHVAEGDFDLALYSWPATPYPATDARPLFAKPQAIPGGELFIQQNYTRVGTDHIDQLLTDAAAELDDERRAELLHKADQRLWAAAGSIPLYQRPQLVAADAELAGVGAYGLATPRYQDIGYRR